MKHSLAIAYSMGKRKKMAAGGEMASGYESMPEARDEENEAAMSEDEDMIDRIMRKRMSEGGKVANETEPMADGMPAEFDDLVLRDDLSSSYGKDDNSGDALGNSEEDADREDIVARVMRSRAKGGRMPRPA